MDKLLENKVMLNVFFKIVFLSLVPLSLSETVAAIINVHWQTSGKVG